jgi:hypothetical protein
VCSIALTVLAIRYPTRLSVAMVAAITFYCMSLIYGVLTYIGFKATETIRPNRIVLCMGPLILGTYYFGQATAHHEIFLSQQFYTIITKETSIQRARLVRSSSNGFIISVDEGNIRFIPTGEIKQIIADAPLGH